MFIRMTPITNTHRIGVGAPAGRAGDSSPGWGGPVTRAARWAAALAVLGVLAIYAGSHDSSPTADSPRVVTIASAPQAAGLAGDVRVARTPTEQLSLTRFFAAKGYEIHGVGLDRRVAVDPVAARYPDTRFTLSER